MTPLLRALLARSGLRRLGRGERAYFDEADYRARNPDVAAAGADPFTHYMDHGWREGRDPAPGFSTLFYRDGHLGGAATNPLTHYVAGGGRAARLATAPPSPTAALAVQRAVVQEGFDAAHYALQAGHTADPVAHYLTEGWRRGYSPAPGFDPSAYAREHGFLAGLAVAPFYHHASQRRMRQGAPRPGTAAAPRAAVRRALADAFDARHYLARYADVRRSGADPLDHYLDHGWREGREPTALFDGAFYLAGNRDVAASGANPFHHYLTVGRAEGRRPNPAGTRLYPALAAPDAAAWDGCKPAADVAGADCVVVMPVYRGYDETLAAIHAVLAAPQRTRFALHVVDDAGPDPRLAGALDALAARGLLSLARNPANRGFVATCNAGLRAFTDREVVLLNADAVVHGDWLDRLLAHAARDPRVATVTPLSNNATICSYPVGNGDNLIELECPADGLDDLARACNAGRSSALPTGVGFCFLMTRTARDALGLFDEAAFGRGYGEENDFCLRAAKAGWLNLLAEDVFVYHAGRVSFGAVADDEAPPGQAALNAKHPDYLGRVARHLRADPGSAGRMRLDLARLARFAGAAPGGAILFVSHAIGGGITTHVRQMEARLVAAGIAVVHLRVGAGDRFGVQVASDAADAPFCPNLRPTSFHQLRPLLADFLGSLAPRAIHVHSLVGLDWTATTGLMDLVAGAGVPYAFTLHDYSAVCHRNDLVPPDGRYCGLPGVEACRACVAGDRSYPEAVDPAVRRRRYAAFLAGAHAVFAPSADVAERLRGAGTTYPVLLRPHEDAAPPMPPRPRPVRDRRRVAVVGAIGVHKGSQVLLSLARDARARGLPVDFHLIGHSDATEELKGAGVAETGRYADEDEAATLLDALQPDCILLPSIWPETFCYTLSLAFRLAVPPVVFDLGAQRDRVAATRFGFVLPYALIDDPGALNDRLLALPLDEAGASPPAAQGRYPDLLADYYGLPASGAGGSAEPLLAGATRSR